MITRAIAYNLMLAIAALGAWGEPAFQDVAAPGQVRDAVLDVAGKSLYLAVYDRNEVWRVDLQSHETVTRVPVGQGPTALALSADKTVLACVNRLANSVTLLHAPDLSVAATVPCGAGANDVAALADGRFAVANLFADTVTLIQPSDPAHPQTLGHVSSVPYAVAAHGDSLAVATRSPAALLIYALPAEVPTLNVPLPDLPVALAPLNDADFVVATKSKLLVVNSKTGAIAAQRDVAAMDVAVDGSTVHVLTADAVQLFDASLSPGERIALTTAGRALAVQDHCYVVASPTGSSWHIAQDAAVVAATAPAPPAEGPTAPAAPAEVAAPTPTPVPAAPPAATPEPTPIVEAATDSAKASETTPEPAKAEQAPTPPVAADTHTDTVQAAPAEPATPPAPVEPSKRKGSPEGESLKKAPFGGHEPSAPTPGSALGPPSAAPLTPSEKSISEALREKLDFGSSEGGFTLPDWANDLQYHGDVVSGTREVLHLKGSAELELDTTHLAADEVMLNRLTNEMDATGHVVVTQELSSITADDLKYTVPQNEVALPPSPFVLTDEERNKLRLRSGAIEAENVHLTEPTREITADHLQYDLGAKTGELTNAQGRAGQFYFGAQKLRVLGPASADGEDVWVTTCDHDPPHYKIRIKKASFREGDAVSGSDARLQLGKANTPLFWPKWSQSASGARTANFDFDSGHDAELGYYLNFGQQFVLTPNVNLGYRLMPTTDEGIGFGIDSAYDYMETPASPLFRSQGAFHSLYTTKDRGYWELYHRQEVWDDTVLLLQSEQWGDRDFYKDFFYDAYKNRTEPRTFANLTLTKPSYIATATVRQTTNNFVAETERAPEITYHLLEHPIAEHLYFTFDTIDGYNEREPAGTHALRLANVARLTYDWNITEAWNLTPYYEAEATWYSDEANQGESATRFSNTVGATLQTRYFKVYPGAWGFSSFKHVIVPSISYSYRPHPTMDVEQTPRFDALDNVYGHSRIESKISNIVFGRDAKTDQTWPVARLTLYQGNDFSNELRKAEDYEIEMDLRPRQYWGTQLAWEHHSIEGDYDIDQPFFVQQLALQIYEEVFNKPYDSEIAYRYNARYGDYNRFLGYLYYDDRPLDGKMTGRLGFAYTETQNKVFNREILYGLGYRLGEKWGVSFEHRYDFERDKLYQQVYEIRRDLHCWEAAITLRDRESGWDIGVSFNIKAFPGSKVKF